MDADEKPTATTTDKESSKKSTSSSGRRRKGKNKGDDAVQSRKRGKFGNLNDLTDQQHPFNKDGYRYTLAEQDPLAEGQLDPADPDLFRVARLDSVSLSKMDCAPQLKLEDKELKLTGDKGYCMARATHGVRKGMWYYEVKVLHSTRLPDMPEPHTRLGFAQRDGNLQGPVGVDAFSYSWRDNPSSRFHVSRGNTYGEAYGPGDTVGFLIELPEQEQAEVAGTQPSDDGDKKGEPTGHFLEAQKGYLVIYRGFNYYEEVLGKVQQGSMKVCKGSKITAFKNGKSMGTMFEDLYEGTYYPAVSLYMGAQIQVNFGPNFEYPPDVDVPYNPMSDAVHVKNAELCLTDILCKIERSSSKGSTTDEDGTKKTAS